MTIPFLLVQIYIDDIIFDGYSHSYVKFLGSDRERIPDVRDGRTNIFLMYSSEADEERHLHTSSQVHERPDEVQHGWAQAHINSDEHGNDIGFR
jgi:hypothetical protein